MPASFETPVVTNVPFLILHLDKHLPHSTEILILDRSRNQVGLRRYEYDSEYSRLKLAQRHTVRTNEMTPYHVA